MSQLSASFPDWLPKYLRDFHELLGVLALSDGFLLIPVEVPGPDIARVLADWLERRGVPALVFEPRTDTDWEELATSLVRSQPPAKNGVAMVIGGRSVPAGMRHGLRFINQRRDSLSRHLARPLLWCGPASFLDTTWDLAPDFWSVRAVEQRIMPEAGGDALDSLRSLLGDARAQGDLASEARLAVQLADDLTAAGALTEAAVLIEETLTRARSEPAPVWAELAVRQGRILLARDDAPRALAEMNALLERTLPASVADDALLVIGVAHEKMGAPDRAVKAYEQALSRALTAADPTAEIRARIGLGSNGPAAGLSPAEAAEALEVALAKARAAGDASLEAEALRALSRVTAGLHDQTGSEALLDEARRRELPEYPDNETYQLAMSLEAARRKRAALFAAGESTADIDEEILSLRRKLREGGQLRAGDSLGDDRYLLLKPLGRGGFSVVWEALDRRRNERVAVKVLYPQLAGDPVRRERFFRGARVMSQLKDEAVVQVLEPPSPRPGPNEGARSPKDAVVRVVEPSGEDGGFYYFVMELVSGGDFRRAVLERTLPPDRVLPILLTIAGALSLAHAHGLVHRDVKPGNILLGADFSPKLTDFDLVADVATTGGTRSGAMGTFLYAAPEVLSRPQDADARADVYGLGMTAIFGLYGDDLPLSAVRSIDALIDRLDCSAAVKAVLHKAVAWEPEDRYSDAGMFAAALRKAMSEAAEEAPAPAVAAAPPASKEAGGSTDGEEKVDEGPRKAEVSAGAPGDRVQPPPLAREPGHLVLGRWLLQYLYVVAAASCLLGLTLGLGLHRLLWPDSLTGPLDAGSAPLPADAAGGAPPGTTMGPAAGGSGSSGTTAPATTAAVRQKSCPPGTSLIEEGGPSFCIDQSPVEKREYKKCAAAGRCEAIRAACADFREGGPAACIDWLDATNYCRWVGGWLPLEAQWRNAVEDPAFAVAPGFREWISGATRKTEDGGSQGVKSPFIDPEGRELRLEDISRTSQTITFRCVMPASAVPPG